MLDWDRVSFFGEFGIVVDSVYLKWSETMFDFDSASDTGITQGQGLGVGGIPPGLLKQITAANIFEIQEGITGIDEEVDELRELIESNNLDVNLEEYDKSINLAKEVLARK